MQALASVFGSGIGSQHEGKSKGLKRILVFVLLELVVKGVNLVFLFDEGVVVELQHLLLSLLVYHDHLVDVTLCLRADSFLVDEREDAHRGHLSAEVVDGVDASAVELPELGKVLDVEYFTVFEVGLLVEAVWLQLVLFVQFVQLFLFFRLDAFIATLLFARRAAPTWKSLLRFWPAADAVGVLGGLSVARL